MKGGCVSSEVLQTRGRLLRLLSDKRLRLFMKTEVASEWSPGSQKRPSPKWHMPGRISELLGTGGFFPFHFLP